MAERMIQVPVSLIQKTILALRVNTPQSTRRARGEALAALLSQPTPTAEPMSADEFSARWRGADAVLRGMSEPAAPPSIAEMVPGTTFEWEGHRFMRLSATAQYPLVDDGGFLFDVDSIDPSTIRNITPPGDSNG